MDVAHAGDYIVTNPGGERYVVAAETFEKRYAALGDGRFEATGNARVFQNPTSEPIEITAPGAR